MKEKKPKEKKEKPPKVKKEKPPKVKKEKPPKVKKEKPPKVKKEKPPKVKKEKPPKVKKEKKKKNVPEGAEGEEEGGGGGGKKKLLLILLPVLLVVAAGAVFLVTRVLGRMPDPPQDGDETVATDEAGEEEAGDAEDAGDGEDGEGADAEGGEETEGEEPPAPAPTEYLEIRTTMTTSDVVNFFRRIPPERLGLSGDSMDDYEIFPSDSIVRVDGHICSRVIVYSDDGTAGTNEVVGTFFLSRDFRRLLYRYDAETGTVTQIDTSAYTVHEDTGTVTLNGEEAGEEGEEEETEEAAE